MTTCAQANHDRPRSVVLRRLIAAPAAGAVLLLLAGWRSGATHAAALVASEQALSATTITLALADVAVLTMVAA